MVNEKFTYAWYKELISLIRYKGYSFIKYEDKLSNTKNCILRHDVDFSIDDAVSFARLEKELGVCSTFFVLLKTDFYNPFSPKNIKALKEIITLGHDIGLHFDEKAYDNDSSCDLVSIIKKECLVFSEMLDYPVSIVSMHRPSKRTLESNYKIPGIINSYSERYFKEFKYVSDSRRRWREDIEQILDCDDIHNIHLLTHPFWYDSEIRTAKEKILSTINKAKFERTYSFKDNLTDFDSLLED